MTALEIVLMICGIVCVIVSFMMGNGKNDSSENQSATADLNEKQKESIRNQINAVFEQELEQLNEKTEAALDKISNIKIMEMNEYADTVLNEINKNHNEAVFLYDMLNDRAKEIKSVVKDFQVAKKQVERIHEEVAVSIESIQQSEDYDFDKESTAAALQILTHSNVASSKRENSKEAKGTLSEGNSKVSTKKNRNKKVVPAEVVENVSEMNIQFEKGSNNNEKILNLFNEGKSNKEIAKLLNLGVGEVKLVIDLYNSGR